MDIFWPSKVLSNVDLPTLGGPTRAAVPILISLVIIGLELVDVAMVREKSFLLRLKLFSS